MESPVRLSPLLTSPHLTSLHSTQHPELPITLGRWQGIIVLLSVSACLMHEEFPVEVFLTGISQCKPLGFRHFISQVIKAAYTQWKTRWSSHSLVLMEFSTYLLFMAFSHVTVLEMRSESGLNILFPPLRLLRAVINVNQANVSLAWDSHIKNIECVSVSHCLLMYPGPWGEMASIQPLMS